MQLSFQTKFSDEIFLTDNWDDFPNQSMGVTEIEGVNEKEELEITDVSTLLNNFVENFLQDSIRHLLSKLFIHISELYGRSWL